MDRPATPPERPRPLSAQGVLRVTSNGTVRYVMLDIDLARIPGLSLQGIPRTALVVPPERVPGFTPAPEAEPAATFAEEAETVGSETDWLTAKLLGKPIEDLGLADRTCLQLWDLGVLTVQQLIDWSERDLRGQLTTAARADVLERLNYFGLRLTRVRKTGTLPRSRAEIGTIRSEQAHVSEAQARATLGDHDFDLFGVVESGTPDERIAARNALVMTHHKLALKIAYGRTRQRAYGWSYGAYTWQKHQYNEVLDAVDLYQSGVIGLIRAIEMFDRLRGYRFSTYAVRWIQAVVDREIMHSTGLPIHLAEQMITVRKAHAALWREHGREPTEEEQAAKLRLPVERLRLLLDAQRISLIHISLDDTVRGGLGGDPGTLGNLIADPREVDQGLSVDQEALQQTLWRVLRSSGLLEAELRSLDLFYGLTDRVSRTLEEVGEIMGVTRERIRQRLEIAFQKIQREEVFADLAPYLEHPERLSTFSPGMRWELVYETWRGIRKVWEPSWTPGTALFETSRWYGVAFSDILDGPPEEKQQPLACLLMAICREIYGQSYAAIADRFDVPEYKVVRACQRLRGCFRRIDPLYEGLVLPEGAE